MIRMDMEFFGYLVDSHIPVSKLDSYIQLLFERHTDIFLSDDTFIFLRISRTGISLTGISMSLDGFTFANLKGLETLFIPLPTERLVWGRLAWGHFVILHWGFSFFTFSHIGQGSVKLFQVSQGRKRVLTS